MTNHSASTYCIHEPRASSHVYSNFVKRLMSTPSTMSRLRMLKMVASSKLLLPLRKPSLNLTWTEAGLSTSM